MNKDKSNEVTWVFFQYNIGLVFHTIYSGIFHPCYLLLHFPLLHFPSLQFCPYGIFYSRIFSRPVCVWGGEFSRPFHPFHSFHSPLFFPCLESAPQIQLRDLRKVLAPSGGERHLHRLVSWALNAPKMRLRPSPGCKCRPISAKRNVKVEANVTTLI